MLALPKFVELNFVKIEAFLLRQSVNQKFCSEFFAVTVSHSSVSFYISFIWEKKTRPDTLLPEPRVGGQEQYTLFLK